VRSDDFVRSATLVGKSRRNVSRRLLEKEPRRALEKCVEELRENRARDTERDRVDQKSPLTEVGLRQR
jgi:hypothetical protein